MRVQAMETNAEREISDVSESDEGLGSRVQGG